MSPNNSQSNLKTAGGSRLSLLLGLLFGVIVGGVLTYAVFSPNEETINAETPDSVKNPAKKEPLYWVAPMDPNYRRDKPGQSPMGMDLIPYYGDDGDDSPGTIKVSPDVVNNLGVRTQRVTAETGSTTITGVGVVKYNEEQLFHIHPRMEGWIDKLYIKSSGQEVTKDQPLYEMYSPQLVNAQEELILALKRNDRRLISASEERLKSLQFSNDQIARVKKTQTALQRVTFNSPSHGVVENLEIREGFYVKPGDTMMSIGALDDVWVEVDILEKQASLISLNQPVNMKLDYAPGKTWRGLVDFIYPTLDPMTRTLKVRLRFENPDQALKPNMYASIEIDAEAENSSPMVPNEAVIRTGRSDRVVLALGDGQFKSVDVTLGYVYDDYTEVLDGLVTGDKVVTSAQFLLDSESSKTSDFKRMYHGVDDPAQMDHSNMDHSNMDHSNMDHSNMDHSNMDHSNMDHSKMEQPEMDHSKMDHSNMDHSKMDHSKMDHSNMDHSNMDHSNMDHSNMDHSNMDHSNMDHSNMDHSNMDHSNMDHSKMDHSNMDHSKMEQPEMDHSKMDHSKMDHSKMDHSKMDHSKMDHSKMNQKAAEDDEDGQEGQP